MKQIKNIIAMVVLTLLISVAAQAQKNSLRLHVNYNYSMPMGNFKNDLISNASPRGVSGEFLYSINNKWAAGLTLAYQDYYQKYPRATYQTGEHEVTSAVISNSLQTMPVLAKGMFTPLAGSKSFIQPYISAGVGVSLVDFKQYLGEFGGTTNGAGFMAQGGAGVMIPFGKLSDYGFRLGATYNYIGYNKNDFGNINSVDLQAGLYIPIK